ncbi:MAG: alpha/beta fold hydrolase [Pirellulales bacterium]
MRRLWRSLVLPVLRVSLVVYVTLCLFMYASQTQLIFLSSRLNDDYQFHFPHNFREVRIPVAGTELHGLLFTAPDAASDAAPDPDGVVLFLHGNGGAVDQWGLLANQYLRRGYDVLFVDYRGYGKSGLTIRGEAELHADMRAVYDYLAQLYPEDKITLVGRSIGTGLATRLAAEHSPYQLILESPYFSFRSLAAQRFWYLPTDLLLSYPLKTNEWITQVKCPITLIHGTDDELIPFDHSRRLQALASDRTRLLPLEFAGHNGIEARRDYQAMLDELLP